MTQITATLKNWTFININGQMFLKGHAFHHINPDYASDGDLIVTSAVIDGGSGIVITQCGSYRVD